MDFEDPPSREIENSLDTEYLVRNCLFDLRVNLRDRDYLLCSFFDLELHSLTDYNHCKRMGENAFSSAGLVGLDRKLFYAGAIFHDIGKLRSPSESLGKSMGFSEEDRCKIRPHPQEGYNILRAAESLPELVRIMALRHHCFQKNPYPDNLSSVRRINEFSKEEVLDYCRWISILDNYDAKTTRSNDENGGRIWSPAEVKPFLVKKYPDKEKLIQLLYQEGVF